MPFRAATLRWVDRLIIGQNLCPYTHAVRKRAGALRVGLSAAADAETLLTELDACCDRLAGSNNGAGETALLVLPPTPGLLGERLMDEFLAFLSLGWQLVDRVEKRDPAVQLALFHPRAVRNLYGAEAGEEDAPALFGAAAAKAFGIRPSLKHEPLVEEAAGGGDDQVGGAGAVERAPKAEPSPKRRCGDALSSPPRRRRPNSSEIDHQREFFSPLAAPAAGF